MTLKTNDWLKLGELIIVVVTSLLTFFRAKAEEEKTNGGE